MSKKDKTFIESPSGVQLHVGKIMRWHSDDNKLYWSSTIFTGEHMLTPAELFKMCSQIQIDLVRNHPKEKFV